MDVEYIRGKSLLHEYQIRTIEQIKHEDTKMLLVLKICLLRYLIQTSLRHELK